MKNSDMWNIAFEIQMPFFLFRFETYRYELLRVYRYYHSNGLVLGCNISIAQEITQSYTNPLMCFTQTSEYA